MGVHTRIARCLWLLLGLAWSAAVYAHPYPRQKVVYDLGSGNPARWQTALINVRNHIRIVGARRIRLRLVIHGAGVRMLRAARSEAGLRHQLAALRAEGVAIRVSRSALRRHGMPIRDLPGILTRDLIPSGAAEIVRLEQRGYIYINP